MKPILFTSALLLLFFCSFGQKDKFISSQSSSAAAKNANYTSDRLSKTIYLGPGFGLDYAGLGMKLEIMPGDWISFFAAGGTNFYGAGYNVGISLKMIPTIKVNPTLQGMYGYNGVLLVKDGRTNTVVSFKNYFGFSAGGGLDFTVGENFNKLSLGIWVPIRSEEFKKDIKAINATVFPVAFSFGFKFSVI